MTFPIWWITIYYGWHIYCSMNIKFSRLCGILITIIDTQLQSFRLQLIKWFSSKSWLWPCFRMIAAFIPMLNLQQSIHLKIFFSWHLTKIPLCFAANLKTTWMFCLKWQKLPIDLKAKVWSRTVSWIIY